VTPLTIANLLGPYAREPWTLAEMRDGVRTVEQWNKLAALAAADGVPMPINPATKCHIGGTGNGGARPKGSTVGAPGSKHQQLLALDWYDPTREFMTWLLAYGLEHAMGFGMYFEHPQWTRSWAHGQIVPPGDGQHRWGIFFLPYKDMVKNPCTCVALPGQTSANVPVFDFKTAA
jgi:hypothetical protein